MLDAAAVAVLLLPLLLMRLGVASLLVALIQSCRADLAALRVAAAAAALGAVCAAAGGTGLAAAVEAAGAASCVLRLADLRTLLTLGVAPQHLPLTPAQGGSKQESKTSSTQEMSAQAHE